MQHPVSFLSRFDRSRHILTLNRRATAVFMIYEGGISVWKRICLRAEVAAIPQRLNRAPETRTAAPACLSVRATKDAALTVGDLQITLWPWYTRPAKCSAPSTIPIRLCGGGHYSPSWICPSVVRKERRETDLVAISAETDRGIFPAEIVRWDTGHRTTRLSAPVFTLSRISH